MGLNTKYPKSTRLKSTPGIFETLAVRCDGSHTHAHWGVHKSQSSCKFDTADEAQYPPLLVKRMVQCVVQQLPGELFQRTWKQFRMDILQQTGVQHKHQPPLIPEYATIEKLPAIPQSPPCKVLQTPWPTGESCEGVESKDCLDQSSYKIGFYFSPEEHVQLAIRLEHPASQFHLVPDGLRQNIFMLCSGGIHAMARRRITYLQHMLDTKKLLMADEKKLRSGLAPHVNQVTAGKSLCLFRRLLEETGFPDMEVCNIMEQGVSLTGIEPESPLYWKKYRPSLVTTQQLDHQAKWRRRAMTGKSMTEDELAQEQDLESETFSEVEAGFLQGPHAEAAISEVAGSEDWSLSKRFVLYQGEERKIRVIDNYRDSGVNAAFSSSSYIALQDTDFVIGFLRFFMWVLGNGEEVVVPLSDGTILRGPWHTSMTSQPELLGRCIDLSKAYRQVAIAKDSLRHGVLGYQTSQHGWRYFTTCSLPFGASASVYAFNKISRALWHLLVHGLHILTSVFFDDFPAFEIAPLTHLTSQALDQFFGTLGWKHAITGKNGN